MWNFFNVRECYNFPYNNIVSLKLLTLTNACIVLFSRSAYHGALWYFHHLQEKLPMVMITEDKEFIAEYGTKQINVFVMCMEDYLNTFWAQLTAAHELRESLAMSLEVKKEAGNMRNDTWWNTQDQYQTS